MVKFLEIPIVVVSWTFAFSLLFALWVLNVFYYIAPIFFLYYAYQML